MKAESNIRPNLVEVENIHDDRCDIIIAANIEEITEEENVKYAFDLYRINICYNENIKNEIQNNYEKYLQIARDNEYKILAAEIRKKRDDLLKETDKDMCLDRLNIHLPQNLTATTLLSEVKQFIESFSNIYNGNMARYRQELRDIPEQEGFPFNVVFPVKPNTEAEDK